MSRKLSILGFVLTAAYVWLLYFIFDGRIVESLSMKPNEIGDLLAGMFGPLAILWLILGFFQQGIELRQNTRALELQAEELKNSVEQQRDLVEVSRKQFESHLDFALQEEKKWKSAAQPVFVFNTDQMSRSNDEIHVEMTIQNIGAAVTNVEFSWSQDVILGMIRDMTTFEANGKMKLSWRYKVVNINPSRELWLSAEFTDSFNNRAKHVFDFLPGGKDGFFGSVLVDTRKSFIAEGQ